MCWDHVTLNCYQNIVNLPQKKKKNSFSPLSVTAQLDKPSITDRLTWAKKTDKSADRNVAFCDPL